MANLKIGPAIGVTRGWPTLFALELDAGYGLLDNSLYITFSPQFNFGDATIIHLPVGAQYDIRIAKLGPGELMAYPRLQVGYARVTSRGGGNAFTMMPEAGAKYVIGERWNVGVEPLSFAIYAGDFQTQVAYRILVYGGVNF